MDLYPRTFVNTNASRGKLRFMQWNVLADGLSGKHPDQGGFILTPPELLDWSYRFQGILAEIERYDPDILVCEELDHFEQLKTALSPEYDAAFAAKRPSPCLLFNPDLEDGVAVFARRSILKFSREPIPRKFTNTAASQVALFAHLVFTAEVNANRVETPILVAVTHLKATKNEEGETARQYQAAELLQWVKEERGQCALTFQAKSINEDGGNESHATSHGDNIAKDTAGTNSQQTVLPPTISPPGKCVPVIIGADLNATPLDKRDYKARAYPTMTGPGSSLVSAYRHVCGEEPSFTTWKERHVGKPVKHTIDYVFYSPGDDEMLTAVNVLQMPQCGVTEDDQVATPNQRYPSDHFSLVVDFDLTT